MAVAAVAMRNCLREAMIVYLQLQFLSWNFARTWANAS